MLTTSSRGHRPRSLRSFTSRFEWLKGKEGNGARLRRNRRATTNNGEESERGRTRERYPRSSCDVTQKKKIHFFEDEDMIQEGGEKVQFCLKLVDRGLSLRGAIEGRREFCSSLGNRCSFFFSCSLFPRFCEMSGPISCAS